MERLVKLQQALNRVQSLPVVNYTIVRNLKAEIQKEIEKELKVEFITQEEIDKAKEFPGGINQTTEWYFKEEKKDTPEKLFKKHYQIMTDPDLD